MLKNKKPRIHFVATDSQLKIEAMKLAHQLTLKRKKRVSEGQVWQGAMRCLLEQKKKCKYIK